MLRVKCSMMYSMRSSGFSLVATMPRS
ncbi:hypothetical protein MC885_000552 [Smutsia gigantea]|nr:hypothetical protein MC885_000552 [Smutsia gigantea]